MLFKLYANAELYADSIEEALQLIGRHLMGVSIAEGKKSPLVGGYIDVVPVEEGDID
jgi:hypothetical protein